MPIGMMANSERLSNSTFISYRRTENPFLVRSIWEELTDRGLDVFLDVEDIKLGRFDAILKAQIEARPYFLIVLLPGTLPRCVDPDDWVRREIETAVRSGRRIIPVHTREFDFADIDRYLPPAIASEMRRWNAVEINDRYFRYVIEEIGTKYLVPIAIAGSTNGDRVDPTDADDTVILTRQQINRQLSAANKLQKKMQQEPPAPGSVPEADKVTARDIATNTPALYYYRAFEHYRQERFEQAIRDYTMALQLAPDLAEALFYRGVCHLALQRRRAAIHDFTEALYLKPTLADAYYHRGCAHLAAGDLHDALEDLDNAVKYNGNNPEAYNARGTVYTDLGKLDEAISDYTRAIQLNPTFAEAYRNRGASRHEQGDTDGGLDDFRMVLRLLPDAPQAEAIRRYLIDYGHSA
jgi:tetratricopeptide (TPR) repeat protein